MKAYEKRVAEHQHKRGRAFAIIAGQISIDMMNRLKADPDYDKATAAQRPILLKDATDKHTLLQTAEKYPCAAVYEHECNLYGYQQNQIADQQYYERFNTKVDVGAAIGVARRHPVLLNYVAQQEFQLDFDDLTEDDQATPPVLQKTRVMELAEEMYLTYVFIRQSRHKALLFELNNDYSKNKDINNWPKDRQAALRLFQDHQSFVVKAPSTNTDTAQSYLQRGGGGRGGGKGKGNGRGSGSEDWKEKWKD